MCCTAWVARGSSTYLVVDDAGGGEGGGGQGEDNGELHDCWEVCVEGCVEKVWTIGVFGLDWVPWPLMGYVGMWGSHGRQGGPGQLRATWPQHPCRLVFHRMPVRSRRPWTCGKYDSCYEKHHVG